MTRSITPVEKQPTPAAGHLSAMFVGEQHRSNALGNKIRSEHHRQGDDASDRPCDEDKSRDQRYDGGKERPPEAGRATVHQRSNSADRTADQE
jgi:hypothetical protein